MTTNHDGEQPQKLTEEQVHAAIMAIVNKAMQSGVGPANMIKILECIKLDVHASLFQHAQAQQQGIIRANRLPGANGGAQ